MDSQTKRTLIATLACILVLFGWLKLQEALYPQRPQPASHPAPEAQPVASAQPESPVRSEPSSTSGAGLQSGEALFAVVGSGTASPVVLGDARHPDRKRGVDNPWQMAVTIQPRGAAVEAIRLSRYRNEIPRNRRNPGEDPYDLVQPIVDPATGEANLSFRTERLRLVDDKQELDLGHVDWSVEKSVDERSESAILRTTVSRQGQPVLGLAKTYRLEKGGYHLHVTLAVENKSSTPRRIVLFERGPIGFRNEDPQRDARRLVAALVDVPGEQTAGATRGEQAGGVRTVTVGDHLMRADLLKEEGAARELRPGARRTLWTALGNKYFAAIVTWLPLRDGELPYAEYLGQVRGLIPSAHPHAETDIQRPSDLTFEQVLSPEAPIAPGDTLTMRCDIYCGPKSDRAFQDPAVRAQAQARNYEIVTHPDRAGCTFQAITTVMLWLLEHLYRVTGNYGVAIIILVLIVRTILHPVTKSGQVRMMKMQKHMAVLKPRLDAIQQQYKNDKQKLNEEMMKVYREYGVNPGSQMLGCLPMLLQMPIWVALWTTLNTNVGMRHEPFFGWIRDLSAPDALYRPDPLWNLHLPLIGLLTGPIYTFNLLPIIMAATMYAQQKFTQKLTKPATPPPPALDADGNPLPDQMAQQQKIMSVMMLVFGLMFYNFPSGLNLYILSSNLMGMLEQYLIRKHIREKEAQGEFNLQPAAGPPKGPSLWERLQKRAETARMRSSHRSLDKARKHRKQPRF